MARSPLYKNFAQELQKQAKRDFNKSTYGKIIKGMNDLERRGAGAVTTEKVNKLIDKYGRGGFDQAKVAKEIQNKELAQLTKTLETYAKRGGADKLIKRARAYWCDSKGSRWGEGKENQTTDCRTGCCTEIARSVWLHSPS